MGAETVGDLLVKIGADTKGLTEADIELKNLAVTAENLAKSFEPVSVAADKAAASIASIGGNVKGIDFTELGRGVSTAALNVGKIETASAAAGVGLKEAADAARLADGTLRDLSTGAGRVAKSLVDIGISGGASAVNLQQAGRGLLDLAKGGAAIIEANPSGAIASIASSIAEIAPPVAIATAAYVAFKVALSGAQAEIDKSNAKLAVANKTAADSFNKLQEAADKLHFDAAEAGLSDLHKAIVKTNASIRQAAADTVGGGGIFAFGEEAARRATAAADLTRISYEKAFAQIALDSERAAAALNGSFINATRNALDELGKLERGNAGIIGEIVTEYGRVKDAALPLADAIVKVKPSEEVLQGLRALGESLDFKGPLAEMATLQKALDQNAEKVRQVAAETGLGEEFIRNEIAKTSKLIKDRFKEDLKLKVDLDPSAAKTAVDDFLKSAGGLPPATLKTDLDTTEAIRTLDLLRSKIVDTPPGELKIALAAKADQLDASIKKEQEKERDPIVIPVDGDTSEIERRLADLADSAQTRIKQITDQFNVINSSRTIGNAASVEDLANEIAQARSQATSAISSGDATALLTLQKQLSNFLQQFSNSQAVPTSNVKESQEILSAVRQAIALLPSSDRIRGELAIRNDLGAALADLKDRQTETNSLLHESNDIARANLDASRGAVSAFTTGNIRTALVEKTRQATGVRGGGL